MNEGPDRGDRGDDGSAGDGDQESSVAVVDAPARPPTSTTPSGVGRGAGGEPAGGAAAPGAPSWPRGPAGASCAGRCAGPSAPWPTERVVRVAVTTLTLFITTVVMMNVVHLNPLNPGADLIFDRTTPTGGDMGAHVWGPAFLRDNLLSEPPALGLEHGLVRRHAGRTASTWSCRRWRSSPSTRSCPTAWRSSSSPSPGWSCCRSAAGRSAGWPASATRCRSCSPSPGCASRSTRASASTAAT